MTPECENEVQRIIHLQAMANRLPDAFNDATKVTKSYIPAANAPARIAVPEEQVKMDQNPPHLKCGRPIGSKDTAPRKRRGKNQESAPEEPGVMLAPKELIAPEEAQTHEMSISAGNTENSITYSRCPCEYQLLRRMSAKAHEDNRQDGRSGACGYEDRRAVGGGQRKSGSGGDQERKFINIFRKKRYLFSDTDGEGRPLVDAGFSVFRDNEELPVGGNIGPELEHTIDDSRIYLPIFSEGYASSAWLKRGWYGEDLLWHEGFYGKETVREWREALKAVTDLKGWDVPKFGLGKLLVRELSIKLKKGQKVLPDHLVGIDDRVKDVMQLLDCGSMDRRFFIVHGMGGIGKTTLAKAVFNEIAPLFDGCSFLSVVQERSQCDGIVSLQNQLLSDILKRSLVVHNVDDGVNMIQERFRNKRVLIVLDDVDEIKHHVELIGNPACLSPGSRIIVTTRNKDLLRTVEMGQQDNVPSRLKGYYDYEMTVMNNNHTLELFSKWAFGETLPQDDLKTFSSEIVASTGGLPLALEIIGSFLYRKRREIWKETLERLKEISERIVLDKLKISYDALDSGQKQIFLDLACFFKGVDSKSATYVWKDCGLFPESGLAALTKMSLLKIEPHNILRMHDLVKDVGWEIVRGENYQDAGGRSWLWESEECLHLLRELNDYRQKSIVESLRLLFPKVQTLSSQEFAALPKLRLLHVDGVKFTGDYKNLLRKLRCLSWDHCPADFDATNFSPSNLIVLKLSHSELRDDWPGWHQITKSSKSKVLELGECSRLTRLPFLSALLRLERLIVRNCQSLVEVDESIGKLVHLNYLEIDACKSLRELPEEVGCLKALKELIVRGTILGPVVSYLPNSIGNLQSLTRLEMESVGISELPHRIGELKDLESLCLSRCYELRELPNSIGGLESLLELDLSHTKVTELPESIGFLRKLKVIRIDHSEVRKIPGTIGMVEKLEEFHAEKCLNLEGDIPNGMGSLSSLKILNLSHTRIRSVPTTINQLSHLQELHLEGCHKLKRIPEPPASLINLHVESRLLETVPNLSKLTNLVNLIVSDYSDECPSNPWDANSIQTPNLKWVGRLYRLERLKLIHKSIIALPTELASVPGLERLVLSCFDLQLLTQPLPPTLSMLKLINFNSLPKLSCRSDFRSMSSLELCKSWLIEIPLSRFGQLENLRELTMSNCAFLVRLSHLSCLKKLKVLCLLNCPKLVEIQDLIELKSLEGIRIDRCNSLVRLPNLLKMKKLRTIEIRFCKLLLSLPFLSWEAIEDCHLVVDGCDKLANHDGLFRLHKYKKQCPDPRSRL
ncbi:disease resistance protein RUN1-like [Eucalyptus grandis]|uniref:disease resistance protein RUN1-like n=1 Tax=Eucalyptus grandis TaxID=71139 RepID=UPI00192EF4E8|nr:disease resistance protein RUN1-like [Eucalyptus grandis]